MTITFSLDGQVALVTGAAQGLGLASAVALARAGADVAVCDRDSDGLTQAAQQLAAGGGRVVSGVLDVRDAEAVDAFVLDVVDQLGGVHVIVNNAGGTFWAPFTDIASKGQQALVDENFTSVTNVVRACLPHLGAGASIVNVTTIEAHRAAPGFSIYAAMKAAVENLTKTLALELADRGIRVNALAPDAIPTPGDAGLADALGGEADYAPKVPLGLGTPDDFAGPVLFLASNLSRFVTGTVVHVDGGTHGASGWTRRADGTWRP